MAQINKLRQGMICRSTHSGRIVRIVRLTPFDGRAYCNVLKQPTTIMDGMWRVGDNLNVKHNKLHIMSPTEIDEQFTPEERLYHGI